MHFGPNLIAAAANSRADRGAQVAWVRAKPAMHFPNAFFYDPPGRPSPAGMKNTHGLAFGIDKDTRHAISGEHRQSEAGGLGNEAVSGERFVGGCGNVVDDIRVDLTHSYQCVGNGRERRSPPHTLAVC